MENTVAEETAIVTQSLDLQVKAFNLGTLETNAKTILEVVKVKLAGYKAENYSGDNIAKAKADKAELNAAAKKLSDARLEYERTWMKPFEDSFKDVVAETCALIKTASAAIDQVVKDVETREKNEKRKLIETYFATLACIYFDLEKIFDPAWLNKTAKMKDIQTQITDRIKKTTGDLDILNKLGEPEAQSHYLITLDLNSAISKANEIKANRERLAAAEKAKADAAEARAKQVAPATVQAPAPVVPAPVADPEKDAEFDDALEYDDEPEYFDTVPVTPEVLEFTLRFHGTKEQLFGLKEYMLANSITYEKIA